jgi:hypothetical protein
MAKASLNITLYDCGCKRFGNPIDTPPRCDVHDEVWTVCYLDGVRVKNSDGPEPCKWCEDIASKDDGYGPSHRGSIRCESGSIASGGRRSHCTCDTCF